MEAKRIRITDIEDNSEFDGESRVIGNKRIKLDKESITHGENVTFLFVFTTYFNGELCEFRIPKVSAKVHIEMPQEGQPQKINLIITEAITCYFDGGKLCLKKGKSINYTQIDKK